MDTLTIKLAGTEYRVPRLTLRQARALGIGVLKETPASPADQLAGSIDQSAQIISIALSKVKPEMTVDAILDSAIDIHEARAAADAIIEFAGYTRKAGIPSGEEVPGAQ
jgi:hypothetical protein